MRNKPASAAETPVLGGGVIARKRSRNCHPNSGRAVGPGKGPGKEEDISHSRTLVRMEIVVLMVGRYG
jgi:hypothetical protein